MGIFVVFFLAALAGYGFVALTASLSPRSRGLAAAAVCAVLLAEYRVRPLDLVPYPNTAPPLYAWLATQPRGVVAEFPMPTEGLPGPDPEYAYLSTFHWQPTVNGYSGFYPVSYLNRLDAVGDFPDEASLVRLRGDGVRYLIVHLAGYDRDVGDSMLRRLRDDVGLAQLTELSDGRADAVVFGLR